jgi:hypothetical protein
MSGFFCFIDTINGVRRWISNGETNRDKAINKIPTLCYEHRIVKKLLLSF